MNSKLRHHLLARRSLSVKPNLRNYFSLLADGNITKVHSQTLFSHFAATKFNIALPDIARMLKFVPSLEKLKTLDKVEQFVRMLNKHGCKEEQIAKIMRIQPSLIITSAERIVEPKIQLLKDSGIEGENLAQVLTKGPSILTSSLEGDLRPNMKFLKNVFHSQAFLIKALLKYPSILKYSLEKTLKPSLAFWEECGFRGTALAKFLSANPRVLSRTSLAPAQADLIQKIGIDKGRKTSKYVIYIVAVSRIETLVAKMDNLQVCGFSAEETCELFRIFPRVFSLSEENVKEKIGFLVNNTELSLNFVAKHPRVFSMSLERVIKPRMLVLQDRNGVVNLEPTRLYSILLMPETEFVSKIIKRHPKSTLLWTIYENAIANVSSGSKITRKRSIPTF